MKNLLTTFFSLLFVSTFAQDRTTVNAMNSEISDNLDLRAVASIFGDSKDLEDFEYRLNDPKNQISNLDLNNDNQVDYLRVIESVEGRTHIIVIQSVLGRDQFQDVATVEVEKDSNNRVQIQVVGDVYMYGSNYIYEPVFVSTPIIYNYFWTPYYRPYCSSWYWGYYPSFYYAWNPFPIFRYRSHIGLFINFNHHYNYVNYRRCHVAYQGYYGRRANAYERQYPDRSFASRNSGYTNRYELDRTRNIRTVGTRTEVASNPRNSSGRNETATPRSNDYGAPRTNPNTKDKNQSNPRSTTESTPRDNSNSTPRSNPRSTTESTPRDNATSKPRSNPRSSENVEATPRSNPRSTSSGSSYESTPRSTPRSSSYESTPRSSGSSGSTSQASPRSSGGGNESSSRGNSGSSSGGGSSRGNSGGSRR